MDESNRQLNKIWADKGSGFCNRSMKSRLQNNDIEKYSIHKKEKSVVAERFVGNLKNNICKYRTSV